MGGGGKYSLDNSQRAAAYAERGPLLVGAGPGTGKTRTLTARVFHLVRERGERPESLLALTFSRRAAEEMRERIAAEEPEIARRAFISTFHAYGHDLLRRYWQEAGLPPRPLLLDRTDAFALLERRVGTLGLNTLRYLHDPTFPLPDILSAITRAKEDLIAPDEFAARAAACGDERLKEVAAVYRVYEDLLREAGAVDFADLVARPVRLLQNNPRLLHAERARWRHLLIDEYQDVNRAGALLVRLLAGDDGAGLWAVGDLRQAIYAFRGASPANVSAFETDYPTGRRTELAVNYRSRPNLVTLFGATQQQQHSRGSEDAPLWHASRDGEAAAVLAVAADDDAQAMGIARRMRRFTDEGYSWGQQVVLCRTRAQAAAMQEALRARDVPVQSQQEGGLLACPDIKTLLILLSRAFEPHGPARHSLPDLPEELSGTDNVVAFLAQALFGPYGLARRMENGAAVARLLALAQAFQERASILIGGEETQGRAFLRHIRRMARLGGVPFEEDSACESDAVRVLTVHASKGLEFPVVFVPNLSQGKFPARGRPSLLSPLPRSEGETETDDGEEETRLFFVALTRARDHLILSRAERYNGRSAAASPLLTCLDGAVGLQREVWDAAPPAPSRAAASEPPSERGGAGSVSPSPQAGERGPGGEGRGRGGQPAPLEARDAELYLRCPRRFFYERVLALPHAETHPYSGFQKAVRHALRAAGEGANPAAAFQAYWPQVGPDPAHPHEEIYRLAAEEILTSLPPETVPPQHPATAVETLTVALEQGTLSVRPDVSHDSARLECHTFRKPPKEDKVEVSGRHSLLREAAEQAGAPSGQVILHLRYVTAGQTLPVPDKPAQRKKHLAKYNEALRGIRLQVFSAAPDDADDCPACPYFFLCPA